MKKTHDLHRVGGCAIPRIDGLGIRPVAVIASVSGLDLDFRLTVGMTIAQMLIHLCLQTSVNRSLQQTFDQFAGVICGRR